MSKDFLKIRYRGLATSSGHILSIEADIPSKPLAFLLTSFSMILTMFACVKVMSCIELLESGEKAGSEESISNGRD